MENKNNNKNNGLKVGKLLITYDDLRNYLGLSHDTQFIFDKSDDVGIIITVIANGEENNHQDFLVDARCLVGNTRRKRLDLLDTEASSKVHKSQSEAFKSIRENIQNQMKKNGFIYNEETQKIEKE